METVTKLDDAAPAAPGGVAELAETRRSLLGLTRAELGDLMREIGVPERAVRMRANINRQFTLPDARLVWLGGPRILETRFGTWHKKLTSTDQRWLREQMSPVKAVEVVPLMLSLADESTVRAHATNWILENKDFAMPIVDRLASVHNPNAEKARTFLKSLEA